MGAHTLVARLVASLVGMIEYGIVILCEIGIIAYVKVTTHPRYISNLGGKLGSLILGHL